MTFAKAFAELGESSVLQREKATEFHHHWQTPTFWKRSLDQASNNTRLAQEIKFMRPLLRPPPSIEEFGIKGYKECT